MKYIIYELLFFVFMCLGVSLGDQVEKNYNIGLVQVSFEEKIRRDVVSVFGDLDKYEYIIIHPSAPVYASVIQKDGGIYSYVYWRKTGGGVMREIKMSGDEIGVVIGDVFSMAKREVDIQEIEEDGITELYLFRKVWRGDVTGWESVGIRLKRQSIAVSRMLDLFTK